MSKPPSPSSHTATEPGPPFGPSALLATLAGVLDFVAFPGIGVWPLAFVCLVPLFFALDARRNGKGHSTRRVIALGGIFGLVGNLGGFYWLIDMLENFSGFPTFACLFFAAIVCAYQGGLQTLFVWLWHHGTKHGWPSLLVAPAAFATAEMVWPLLFPYYHGAHLHNVPWLVQSAELGGPILLTCLVVVGNVGIYALLAARFRSGPFPKRTLAVAVLFLVAAVCFGALRVSQVQARMDASEEKTVGLVQVSMGIFAKRQDPREGLRRHISDSQDLLKRGDVDLLVWPESAYSWLLPPNTQNVKNMVTGPLEVPLLFGGLRREQVPGADASSKESRLYNTAFLTDALGNVQGRYDKTFLLAFGEYIPFGEMFPILYEWSPNSGHFTPGSHVNPLPWGDYRITALICYEDIVPRFTRTAVAIGDPHLLVSIANDAWFGESTAPWQHMALAQLRAVEHRRFLVRATNSGVSAIIDATGKATHTSGVFTREQLRGPVRMMNGWTLYQSVGDWPGYLGILIVLITSFRRRKPKRAG